MPAQPADIADEANVPQEDATRAIELFKGCSYEMLTEEGGVLRVINWGKRQYENDSSAARTRRYRERQNQHKLDGRVPQGRSDSSCDVTGDAAKSSRSSAYSHPQSDCGKVCGNGGEIDRNPTFPTLSEDALSNAGFQTFSSGMRHRDNHSDVTRDGGCDVTGNVTGDVTLQSYRNTVSNIEIPDMSESILSASEGAGDPEFAPERSAPSAPDGAVCADDVIFSESPCCKVSDTSVGRDSKAGPPQAIQDDRKAADDLARASPLDATKPTSQDGTILTWSPPSECPPARKTIHPNMSQHDEPEERARQEPFGPHYGHGTVADSSDVTAEPKVYFSRRKRKLGGWKLKAFEEFWNAFNFKRGKAEAADAWLDISNLSPGLATRITEMARKEAAARPTLIAKGGAPKWAQGWLTGRRWEDWENEGAAAHDQDSARSREENHDAKGSQGRRDEEPQYRESVREALKRFL